MNGVEFSHKAARVIRQFKTFNEKIEFANACRQAEIDNPNNPLDALEQKFQTLFLGSKAFKSAQELLNYINKYSPDQERDERGRFGAGTGSNTSGMSHRERASLQKSSDSQKDKLYKAESTLAKPVDKSEKPVSPQRDDFKTYDDYAEAYIEYAEKWEAWALEQNTNIISDTAEQYLDGTSKGVQNYVKEIVKSDWFTQQFGDVLQDVKSKVVSSRSYSGQYAYGINGRGNLVNQISIDRVSAKDELTIIHEIAHFATTQSVDAPYEAHGSEYAQNHLFLTEQILGTEAATAMEQAYIDGGVSFGE
jgi:putative metallohydrolase (TIGR04338 family)